MPEEWALAETEQCGMMCEPRVGIRSPGLWAWLRYKLLLGRPEVRESHALAFLQDEMNVLG